MSSNPLIKYLIKIKYLNPALLDDKIRINQIMRKLLAISTSLIIIIFCSSCDNDFDFEISSGNLSFGSFDLEENKQSDPLLLGDLECHNPDITRDGLEDNDGYLVVYSLENNTFSWADPSWQKSRWSKDE